MGKNTNRTVVCFHGIKGTQCFTQRLLLPFTFCVTNAKGVYLHGPLRLCSSQWIHVCDALCPYLASDINPLIRSTCNTHPLNTQSPRSSETTHRTILRLKKSVQFVSFLLVKEISVQLPTKSCILSWSQTKLDHRILHPKTICESDMVKHLKPHPGFITQGGPPGAPLNIPTRLRHTVRHHNDMKYVTT